jgi:hypothetical protein
MASGDERTGQERRRVPRYTPDQLSEPVYVVGSRLLTIGALGLMLEAPVPLAPESSLRLHLVVAGEKAKVDARVRSCVARPPCWGVGVEFERISPEAQVRLERLLARAQRGPS